MIFMEPMNELGFRGPVPDRHLPRFSSQICDYRHATTAGTLPIPGTKWYWNGNASRVVREHISHLGKNGQVERDCIFYRLRADQSIPIGICSRLR